jgi:acetolactate synthase-1/2/3 large subunit
LSALPVDHPLYVGYLGMHGNYAPNVKTNECDLLLAIGMRFDDRVTGNLDYYAKQAKVIHVEIDPAEINKIVKADVAINSDAKAALIALTEQVKPREHKEWVKSFRELDKQEYDQIIDPVINHSEGGIRMAEIVKMISDKTEGEAITVSDVGQHQMITSRYYDYKGTRNNVTSGGLGTMGFALPSAMGAAIARNDQPVIAIIGDGGFQMTIQELGTIAQYAIPVKILVLNNSFLGMVRQWQELFFESRYASTEMTNPDFQMIAEGYGIKAMKVENRDLLNETLDTFLSHQGPIFLEVVVEKEENVFPMIPTGASVSDIRLS